MKYNDRIIKTKVKTGKKEKKEYPLIRWLLIGSLLIQSGFTVTPMEVDELDLVTQEVEQEELDWLITAINNHQLNDLIVQNTIPVTEEVEELKDEDGFVYYDIPLKLDIQRHIFDECQLYEVPYELAMAVMYVETGGTYKTDLRSKTNDSGLFQVNDVHKKWLKESGINDLYNPYQNSSAGIWILKDALSKGDNIHTSLMVYNMGHGGARKLWKKGIYSSKYSRKVVETMDLLFQ